MTAVGEERMGGRAVVVRIFLTITLLPVCMTDRDKDRVRMVQQQSCYYQPHNQELVCQCRMGEDKSFLHLKLREFMLQAGQEVSESLQGEQGQHVVHSQALHDLPCQACQGGCSVQGWAGREQSLLCLLLQIILVITTIYQALRNDKLGPS